MPQLALAEQYLSPQPDLLRLALAGSDAATRAGLLSIINGFDDVGSADEVELDHRLGARLRTLTSDALLIDARGLTAPFKALADLEEPALVLIEDAAMATEALAAGARGVLLRNASPRRIHAALRAVAEGLLVIDDELTELVTHHPREEDHLSEPLTNREREVMQLLASGMQNKEIAHRLGISDHTVKFHVNGILGKLNVETRTEAVVHAARLGLVVL